MTVQRVVAALIASMAAWGVATPTWAVPGDPSTPRTSIASTSALAAGPAFTMDQTLSDGAQLTTIAFDGLAFLTGSLGSDSFFPPGKLADFWGFQYLRDNDPSEMGHNTDFLTRAALNMLDTLTPDQRMRLVELATDQVDLINAFGMKRFELMSANRRLLSGDLPAGATGLSRSKVKRWSQALYAMDGQITLSRARVMGSLLSGLDSTQRARLDAMAGVGMTSWPEVAEPAELRPLSHDEKVAVMTYAGDMFSWYAGSVTADVYFCPERHGTYFGSFYLKDAPAVGNPNYTIGGNITADMGHAFLAALTPAQAQIITGLVDQQRETLLNIVDVRSSVATRLRASMNGRKISETAVDRLMSRYGRLDGQLAYMYASAFVAVASTLTPEQQVTLDGLRKQTVGNLTPTGAYLFSTPIAMPSITDADLFAMPKVRGQHRH